MTGWPDIRNTMRDVADSTVVQVGAVCGDLHVSGRRPAVRSSYLAQVRRIAPADLVGRAAELAELAEFCTAADGPAYRWYRAGAWAGKSALMSWFVLHPPPGTRLVSFFVTARFNAQNDRVAFTDVVLEQLAALLGEPMPAYLTDATRDAHLISMLTEAATACGQRGEHLVLVVDGLDEDRGVTTDPDSYSIAALLPADPVPGLRVLVAGRLNPPIPPDVPDTHPLRDPSIVRELARSSYAGTVRHDAERELKRLLTGTATEQDLLGLVAAAGGGLAGTDLAALTELSEWEIDDELRAVAGRTFRPRSARWSGGLVYVLAHEELQQLALGFLGPARIARYRERLHAWADKYRTAGWPATTPEYLLRGYFQLLVETRDLPRMSMLATSRPRHDRLLAASGGDAQAILEITTTQQALADHEPIDLATIGRLAAYRGNLVERNSRTPVELPAVWAALGHRARAEALIDSIIEPYNRIAALTEWATHTAAQGDVATTGELLDRAVPLLGQSAPLEEQPASALGLAGLAAALGDLDRVRAVIAAVSDVVGAAARSRAVNVLVAQGNLDGTTALVSNADGEAWHDVVLRNAVDALLKTGDRTAAARIARLAPIRRSRASMLGKVISAAAGAGDIATAEALASSITPDDRTHLGAGLVDLARALAAAGRVDEAEARALAYQKNIRDRALVAVVLVLVERGDLARAESITAAIEDQYQVGEALVALVTAHARRRDLDRAAGLVAWSVASSLAVVRALCVMASHSVRGARKEALVERAESTALSIEDPLSRAEALIALITCTADWDPTVEVRIIQQIRSLDDAAAREVTRRLFTILATKGVTRAAALADTHLHDELRSIALTELVCATVAAGAIVLPSDLTTPKRTVDELSTVIESVASAGDLDRAESLAHSIEDPWHRNAAYAGLSSVMAKAGHIDDAVAMAQRITDRVRHDQSLHIIVTIAEPDRAESIVNAIDDDCWRARACAAVALAAVRAGDTERALRLADAAHQQIQGTGAGGWPSTSQWIALARAIAATGDTARAYAVAGRVQTGFDPRRDIETLGTLAAMFVELGAPERARVLIQSARRVQNTTDLPPQWFGRSYTKAAIALGDFYDAERLADAITDPIDRARCLTALAVGVLEAGHPQLASRVANRVAQLVSPMRKFGIRGWILAEIVPTIAATDGIEAATRLTSEIVDDDARTIAVSGLAYHLATTGRPDLAPALLDVAPDTAQGDEAQTARVRALAALGRAAESEDTAALIRMPNERAMALTAIADAVPDRARGLLAQAFQIAEDWTIPLAALSHVDPAALAKIADDLSAI